MFSQENLRHFAIILLFSLIAIFVHGYQYAVSDQEIFIPYILKSADPSLFPHDILFTQSSVSSSIFYPAVSFLTQFINLQLIFFLGYVLFQFVFFMGIYRLANILLNDRKLAYLALLPFFLPKFIGGTATSTYELFFGYRLIGILFLIFYLCYLFENKFLKASTIAGLGIWFHPLSIIPSLLILPIFILVKSKNKFKELIKAGLIFFAILIPFLLFTKASFLTEISHARNDFWLSIIKFRDDYLFASLWQNRAWLSLGLYLTLLFLFLTKMNQRIRKSILLIIVISLSIFALNYLFLEIFKYSFIAQFQLGRSITPLAYIGLTISPFFLTFKNRIQKIIGLLAYISLSLNLFVFFLIVILLLISSLFFWKFERIYLISTKSFFLIFLIVIFSYVILNLESYKNLRQKIQFPKENNDWIDLQLWARANTSKNDLFLVPPDQTGFRIFSQRPIVGDVKDGAVVIYSLNYAQNWYTRINDLKNFQDFNERDFKNLKSEYNFKYFVTTSSKSINFSEVYRNSSFTIYKI